LKHITLTRGERQFTAVARVLSTRVARIEPNGGVTYESRLQFVEVSDAARALLALCIAQLNDEREQRYIRNFRGLGEPDVPPIARPQSFLQLRLDGGHWRETLTTDPAQPESGVTVAASISPREASQLRVVYERSGREGQQLTRAFAAATLA
jgi:hypothetical protein